MLDPEKVKETIQDVQELKTKILERHQDNPTFCLRTETVLNQYINSLSNVTGNVISGNGGSFIPQPLKTVIGKQINSTVPAKLDLQEFKKDEDSFKETIQLLHDGFLNRENIDLLDSLRDIEIRGVAKIAGVENYKEAHIDGAFINVIKDKIKANQDIAAEREAIKEALKDGSGSDSENKTVEASEAVKETEANAQVDLTKEVETQKVNESDKSQKEPSGSETDKANQDIAAEKKNESKTSKNGK